MVIVFNASCNQVSEVGWSNRSGNDLSSEATSVEVSVEEELDEQLLLEELSKLSSVLIKEVSVTIDSADKDEKEDEGDEDDDVGDVSMTCVGSSSTDSNTA